MGHSEHGIETPVSEFSFFRQCVRFLKDGRFDFAGRSFQPEDRIGVGYSGKAFGCTPTGLSLSTEYLREH
jgi:hypothetical protein